MRLSSRCLQAVTYKWNPFSSLPGTRECPTRAVLLAGECLSHTVWNQITPSLQSAGYSGITAELDLCALEEHPDAAVQKLRELLTNPSLGPAPLLVAHSLGSLVAQKYLESFNLAALVMVNPIHPNPIEQATNLLGRLNKNEDALTSLSNYYGHPLTSTQLTENASSTATLNSVLQAMSNPEALSNPWIVQLEPRSVPMLTYYSPSDLSLFASENSLLEGLHAAHGIYPEDMRLSTLEHRLPMMASAEELKEFLLEAFDYVT